MSYFAGIDLHKRYLTLCVLYPIGNVVVQHQRLTTDGLFAVLSELDGPITVAVEATLHWAWLHDRLVAQGYGVQVADPGQVKLISRARCKTDPIDAKKLADLLRSNLLPAIWVPDPTTRAKGNSKATVAAARKLCCYLFWMLKEKRTYPEWLQNRHSNHLLEVRPT